MKEEIILLEHLLPAGSVLGRTVTGLDLCMVGQDLSGAVHRGRPAESGGWTVGFVLPTHHGIDSAFQQSRSRSHRAQLSKKAEICNKFARGRHGSICETIKPEDNEEVAAPAH